MKIKSADFLTAAISLGTCPPPDQPEIAVIGRSNVGKSSLINAFVNRKGLANISKQPGRTQTINFFTINQTWRLVDLPGFGFAKVSKTNRERFGKMISAFLSKRQNLAAVLVLIDSNIPPQQIDLDFTQWLMGEGVPFVLVFTKVDRVSTAKATTNIEAFTASMAEFSDNVPMVFPTSSATKFGIADLHQLVHQVLTQKLRKRGKDDDVESEDEEQDDDEDEDEA